MKELLLQFLADNWEVIAGILVPVLIDFLSRRIPTVKNWSWVDNLAKLMGAIVKNRRKPDTNDQTVGKDQNRVIVDRKKHIISVFLLFALSLPAFSQSFINVKGVRFVNVLDSTQVQPVNGSIYYNEQSHKFRVY